MRILFVFLFILSFGPGFGENIVIQSSADLKPAWVKNTNGWEIQTNKKQVYLYFAVSGTANQKKSAQIMAEAGMIGMVADLIKKVVTYDFKVGLKVVDGDLKVYVEKTVTSVSKNVDISGLVKEDMYWENWKDSGDGKSQFTVYLKYSMLYSKYKQSVKDAWKKEINSADPAVKKKAEEILKKLEGK